MPRRALFRIRNSSIHGRGAFAARAIHRGWRIIEYTGERISHDEADRRGPADDEMAAHHTFLFALDRRTVIDGASGGNAARFFNHSCRPNCEAWSEDESIWLFAARHIRAGEELTYDYAYEMDGRYRPSWRRTYACRCGAPRCRGMIVKLRRRNLPPKARGRTRHCNPPPAAKSAAMLTLYAYAGCGTCRKAKAWLDRHGIAYQERPIRERPPTVTELKRALKTVGGLRRLFNTSGDDYRRLRIRDSLPDMGEDAALKLLARNGNLVKRPFLPTADGALVGFDERTWGEALL